MELQHPSMFAHLFHFLFYGILSDNDTTRSTSTRNYSGGNVSVLFTFSANISGKTKLVPYVKEQEASLSRTHFLVCYSATISVPLFPLSGLSMRTCSLFCLFKRNKFKSKRLMSFEKLKASIIHGCQLGDLSVDETLTFGEVFDLCNRRNVKRRYY